MERQEQPAQSAGGKKPAACVPERSICKACQGPGESSQGGAGVGPLGAPLRSMCPVLRPRGPRLGSKQGGALV